jgi:hypothetical protein
MLMTYFSAEPQSSSSAGRLSPFKNFLASQRCRVSKEKAQLCLPQVTYLGVVFKGQTHSPSHEGINPILSFRLPHTIKQLRAFLGVAGFCRIWIPRYAALSRHLFMVFLILLFGSCVINALSSLISWQVQWIKLQLLVKEYSPLPRHEPFILLYPGTSGDYTGQPLRQVPFPLSPLCPTVSTKQLDESSSPFSPTAVGCLSQRGDLLGLET